MHSRISSLFFSEDIPKYAIFSSADNNIVSDLEDAIVQALDVAQERFENILSQSLSSVTFETVVNAYLRHDREATELFHFLHHLDSVCGNSFTRKAVARVQPRIVAHEHVTGLNTQLYRLCKHVEQSCSLSAEQRRSLALIIRNMEHEGVHLSSRQKKVLNTISQTLQECSTRFSHHVVDSRKAFSYHFSSDEYIREMPPEDLLRAKEEAEKQGKTGWIFSLSPPSYMSIMQYCSSSHIRKQFWMKNICLATSGSNDNRPLVLEILRLRKEKAHLLGYDTYADYVLHDRMARSTQQVRDTLMRFVTPAKKKAHDEYSALRDFVQSLPHSPSSLNHWDIAYYSRKYKKELFHIDEKHLREYFSLDDVLEGLFSIVYTLFQVSFVRKDTPTYHDDAWMYEVFVDGKKRGYVIADFFARPEKRAGAWCDDIRHGDWESGVLPIIAVVSNIAKPTSGHPTLLSHEEVQTLFHEFGHALHVLLSANTYANTGGFSTEWDFVELPSQLLENWTWEPEALKRYAKHHNTKAPFPYTQALQHLRTFQKGMFVLRQSEFAFLDLNLHTSPPPATVSELDAKTYDIVNLYSLLPKPKSYKMYASFGHIFSGGYAAGYYSYLWAEILEADIFSLFQKHGLFSSVIGKIIVYLRKGI